MILLPLAALICGVAANTLGPNRIPWIRPPESSLLERMQEEGISNIEMQEVEGYIDQGGILVLDARKLDEYESGHIPTALPLPVSEFNTMFEQVLPMLIPGDPIIVYCSGLDCDESLELARLLRGAGYENVLLFAGGMQEWNQNHEAGP